MFNRRSSWRDLSTTIEASPLCRMREFLRSHRRSLRWCSESRRSHRRARFRNEDRATIGDVDASGSPNPTNRPSGPYACPFQYQPLGDTEPRPRTRRMCARRAVVVRLRSSTSFSFFFVFMFLLARARTGRTSVAQLFEAGKKPPKPKRKRKRSVPSPQDIREVGERFFRRKCVHQKSHLEGG